MNESIEEIKALPTIEELKFEGGIVSNDPDEFNDGATAVVTGGKAEHIGDTHSQQIIILGVKKGMLMEQELCKQKVQVFQLANFLLNQTNEL